VVGRTLEATLGILNGAIGDYLARTGNGLATEMKLLPAEGARTGKLVVLVHGMMCTETVFRMKDGEDYGSLLARDFGYSPVYVRYNTGLGLPENGVALSDLLEELLKSWPVPVQELLLIGFSLGGLVVRSACHAAGLRGHGWLATVNRAIYIGTPHRGAPAERAGRVLSKLLRAAPDPVTRLLGELGDLRSAGIKDLGDAVLREQDRAQRQQPPGLDDIRHPVPLLPQLRHYLIGGSLAGWLAPLFGDAIVPMSSSTDGHERVRGSLQLPPHNVRIMAGIPHMTLARHPHVYAAIRGWCEEQA
jgi:hypothetical protein